MLNKLSVRITLIFLAAITIGLIASLLVTIQIFEKRFNTKAIEEINKIKTTISNQFEYLSPSVLDNINSALFLYNINISSESDNQDILTENQFRNVLSGNDINHLLAWNKQYYATSITRNDDTFVLLLSGKKDQGFLMVRYALLTITGIFLFVISLVVFFAVKIFVKPIKELTIHTRQLAKGRFTESKQAYRDDEIGELAKSFNQMAREINQLVKMRQDFVSNVTHEFQTPLTSITGISKALQHKKMNDKQQKHYLGVLERESIRLSKLSKNILRLSHLQYEKYALNLSCFSIDEQIRNVLISQEPQWSSKDLKINLELESAMIEADEEILLQVWVNIISNAIKFSSQAGCINVKCIHDKDKVVVTITDQGIGMSQDQQRQLFIPFYKGDDSRTKEGNGLGLSIVKQIIDHHNGTIVVNSKTNGGSSFIISLPKSQQPQPFFK